MLDAFGAGALNTMISTALAAWDWAFITQLTGLTDKWFYKLIKDGAFPAPIKLGRSSRWLKSEVEAWLQARIAQSRP